ncbi:sugar ABC transporter permease [Litorilinea aerophila]|nr:sugar ABC transporter permease [Litorilinea aerophila]MCC9077054.1 sugar ABC transporter permease [Litorilinea aerophila]
MISDALRRAGFMGTRPRGRLARRENLEGWLFASPWILGFLIFTLGPMVASAALSFAQWDIVTPPKWIGFDNFERLGTDASALHALKVTTVYAVVSVPLQIVLGVILALLLNAKISGLRIYRTIYYLPAVLSGVAVALLWRWIFSKEFGLLNLGLSFLGIEGPGWLTDPDWALWALILMSLWGVGDSMVIYLAGLQGIPTELYEAAEVDGANIIRRFFNITLPLLTPVLFFQLIIGIIRSLQVFVQAFIMTDGGPADATLFYVLYLYRNAFLYFRMGYASLLAWVLFVYVLLLTLLVFRSARFWVYYESEARSR